MADDQYEVERILDSRLRRGKVIFFKLKMRFLLKKMCQRLFQHEFLIEWVGYGSSENTWEPRQHLNNCPDKMKEFKQQYARRIFGVKKDDDDGLRYLLEYHKFDEPEVLTDEEAKNRFSDLVMDFYESRLEWINREKLPVNTDGQQFGEEQINIKCMHSE